MSCGSLVWDQDVSAPQENEDDDENSRLRPRQSGDAQRGEEKARAFYGSVLGLAELEKPASLQARGGCWFGNGTLQVHLGIEDNFRPARRAHPAFLVEGLEELKARCEAAGHKVTDDHENPAYHRFFTNDPFGNRIECMELIEG